MAAILMYLKNFGCSLWGAVFDWLFSVDATANNFMSAFLNGDLNHNRAHAWLLGIAIVAEFIVAAGIILESWKPESPRQWIGLVFVFGGVAISAIFTIALFVFDEGIGEQQKSRIDKQQATISAQQSKIIELENPRHLVPSANFDAIGRKYLAGKKFDLTAIPEYEPMMLAIEIRKALTSIGMLEQVSATKDHWTPPSGALPIGTILRPGIAVRACVNPVATPASQATPERILAGLLADSGLGTKASPVFIEPWESDDCAQPDLLHVEVGGKILIPWSPRVGTQVVFPKFDLIVPVK